MKKVLALVTVLALALLSVWVLVLELAQVLESVEVEAEE
jgi:hypothetical protein